MHFYIKNKGIYFKEFEGSDERFLSSLSDRIHEDAREAILGWKNEFNDEPLNYMETEWLDQAFEAGPDEDDDIEVEAFETDIPRSLFVELFEEKVKIIR